MSSVETDSPQLANLLERIAGLYDEKDRVAAEASKINKQLKEAEGLAVELIAASGLDGVRAAGKSWYVREFFGVSIPTENRDKVVEAAQAEGLTDFITVNTSTLKAWLGEQRKKRGVKGEAGLAAGTKFDGLISEFREMRLSRLTTG
jgi:hypothetical protein